MISTAANSRIGPGIDAARIEADRVDVGRVDVGWAGTSRIDIPRLLSGFPRHRLAHLPTPIDAVVAPELDLRLHVKRDDLTGSGLAGNKVRKLEYLVADARAAGCDTLVTCGAVQSNCARALAVAAAATGFRSHLILTGKTPSEVDGNLLISRLAGADVEFLESDDPAERDALLAERTAQLTRGGRRPYLVPFGGSSVIGALGYVQAALEIAHQLGDQAHRFGEIVAPMASGGTYAGLYVGFCLAGVPIRPVGAFVQGTSAQWVPALLDLIHGLAGRLGVVVAAEECDIRLIDARGNGYDRPTDAELDFMVRFTRDTGLLLDPVYSGKAMYALWRYLQNGALGIAKQVMFLHTGGSFGIFPHRQALARALDRSAPLANRPQPRLQSKSALHPALTAASAPVQTMSIASP